MKPIKQVPIKESLTELEILHNTISDFLKPRIELLITLTKDPITTKPQLARKLNVVYNSISKWLDLYKTGGIDKLLEVKRGKYRTPNRRTLGFSMEIYNAIETRHKLEPFQSYTELHIWVKQTYFPEIKYSTLIKYIDIYFGQRLKVGKVLYLPVKESPLELEAMYSRCLPRIKPRIKMLIMLKGNERMSRADIANTLGVSYGSIIKWTNIYKQNGIDGMLKYNLELVITPEIVSYIEDKFKSGKFQNFSEIYSEITKKYLPGIKYYTLHRYIHRHFALELGTAKALQMPIKETLQELHDLYRESAVSKKQRIQMLLLLKEAPGYTKIQLAGKCNVGVGSIHRWYQLYKNGGINSLLEIKLRGRKQLHLPVKIHNLIDKKLSQNPDISITELYDWVVSFYTQEISYNKLYRYVRRHFIELPKVGFSNRVIDNRAFNCVA